MFTALSPEQVDAYLERIRLPRKYHPSSSPVHDIAFLTALHVHHISSIPYENLSIHYSPSHSVTIDADVLYEKIIGAKRGRGGYCMEDGILFHHLLRALGFNTYMAGARIRLRDANNVPSGDYIGWCHLAHIVTLPNGERYALDVSFGGDGPTKPMPLVHGASLQNLGTQEIRLVYEHLPQHAHPESQPKHWIYQYRNSAEKEWNSYYAFPEFEFFPADLISINFWAAAYPTSFQTFTVLVVKFLLGKGDGEDQQEKIVGKLMLNNGHVKRNMGGKTEVIRVCGTEEERVQALKEYFGIDLTDEEVRAISGWKTELRQSDGE